MPTVGTFFGSVFNKVTPNSISLMRIYIKELNNNKIVAVVTTPIQTGVEYDGGL